MINDQTSPEFLDQLKNMARGFMQWISEEGHEGEHARGGVIDQLPQGSNTPGGGAVPMPSAPNEGEQVQPTLLRTRTTTVHDFTPGAGTPGAAVPTTPQAQNSMASDPPVSQAQRGAMHAAAQGKSNIGIPQSVGKEFANADPGGKLPGKVADDGPQPDRFSLSPDGQTIIDNQGGKSYGIEEAMQILFSGGEQQQDATVGVSVPPAGKVTVNPVDNPEINTAKWSMPRIKAPGEDRLARLGDGDGGAALGRLLEHFSGGGKQGLPPRGNGAGLQARGGEMPVRDKGWQSPSFTKKP